MCTATLGTALLFGGVHTAMVCAAAPLVFVAAFLAIHGQPWASIPLPAKLLFALSLYCGLQALPLPAALVRWLSPAAAEIWERAWGVTRPGSSGLMSLSVDRGATIIEALKWAMYGAAFIAAAKYGAARNMARGLLLPFGAALVVAVVTLAHGLARAESVYGIYQPSFGPSIWHIGPLLNPNHLASYLNLGLFCGLGLVLARRRFLPRWAIGLGVAFLVPNAIIAGSRGGIVGFAAGLVAFFVFLPRPRHADSEFGPVPRLALAATLGIVLVVGASFTALLASENTARELYETNVEKFRLLTWAADLAGDFPLFGVGRGAFEGVFAAYRTGVNNEIYTHPENLLAQWLGEWGIVVGLLALVGFVWVFRPRQLGARWSVVASGAVGGVGAMVVQNFADFGLEIPAIALSTIVALGVCWGHARAHKRGREELEANEGAGVRKSHVLGLAMALLLTSLPLAMGAQPLALERQALATRYRALDNETKLDLAELRAVARAAVEAHPAEPYFYRLGALITWRAGDDPMPWLQRAIERGPSLGRTHLLVARVLASRKAVRQALMELRLATTFDPALAPITARAAASWSRDYAMLTRAIPPGAAGVRMLLAIARDLPARSEVRNRLLQDAVSRDPKRKETALLLAQEAVHELEQGAKNETCQGEARSECVARAERWLQNIEAVAPRDIDALLLRTRVLRAVGEGEKAFALLTETCPNLVGRARSLCFKTRLEVASQSASATAFASAVRDFLADTCTDSDRCSAALERTGDMSAARGDVHAALSLYDRAVRQRSEDRLWMKVARSYIRVGSNQRALVALDRVRARAQLEPEYSRLLKSAQRPDVVTK